MGSSFKCVGLAQELILVKIFFRFWGHSFGFMSRLDSSHIVHFYFSILIRWEGVIWI